MEIERLRRETPGIPGVIHFNNAGAALVSSPVYETVKKYWEEESQLGGYELAARYAEEIAGFYSTLSRFLGTETKNVAWATSATDAWTRLFYSLNWQPGDIILTGESEYASNYIAFLQVQRRYGVEVQTIPSDESGSVSVDALAGMMSPKVKLVAITHMPTNGGLVNPAEAIGKVAKQHGVLYLLDACQAAGQYPLDVNALGCDMLTATGRKYVRGPRGTGFMYVSDRVLEDYEPFMLDLSSAEWVEPGAYVARTDARVFEAWERNYANVLGLKAALEYAMDIGVEVIWQRVQALGNTLRQMAGQIPGVAVCDLGTVQSGIVSLELQGADIAAVIQGLRQQKIHTSHIVPSGTRLDMDRRQLSDMLRVSVHYYNTEEEIQRFVEVLPQML